jgi:hypothetical protein
VVETAMTPALNPEAAGSSPAGGTRSDWAVDGRPKGVTEERLTLKRCVGRNVHPASLRGQGMPLAVHDGGWQACRRATDGAGRRSSNAPPRLREASPSSQLLPSGCRGDWPPRRLRVPENAGSTPASQTLRGRGAAVLASLMSSRPWVRIPPALPGGVAQTSRALACQARGRRFESGRPRFHT